MHVPRHADDSAGLVKAAGRIFSYALDGWVDDVEARLASTPTPPDPIPPDPIPPDPSGVVLPVFEVTLQPNNTDDPSNPSNHYTAAWTSWNSPATPRAMPNGEPAARALYDGDHFYVLKAYKWLTDEGCGRVDNWHAWAAPGVGWETGVSSRTLDCYPLGDLSHSGSDFEANFEYERDQDVHDDQPHSGGMSVALPGYLSERNVWHWLLVECQLGNAADGIFRCWDWETGELLVSLVGINTLATTQTGCQGWEGGYNSSGVPVVAKCRQTPGLYAVYVDGPAAVLNDQPELVSVWGTQGVDGAPASSIQLDVEQLAVPAAKLTGVRNLHEHLFARPFRHHERRR